MFLALYPHRNGSILSVLTLVVFSRYVTKSKCAFICTKKQLNFLLFCCFYFFNIVLWITRPSQREKNVKGLTALPQMDR